MAREPHFVVKYSSYLGTAIKLVLYILKQLLHCFVDSCRSGLRGSKHHPPSPSAAVQSAFPLAPPIVFPVLLSDSLFSAEGRCFGRLRFRQL